MSGSTHFQRLELADQQVLVIFPPVPEDSRGSAGSVVLLDGAASIFGVPLLRNTRYRFNGRSVTIVCVGKTRVEIFGEDVIACPPETIDSELPTLAKKLMPVSTAAAAAASLEGPVILVVGDKDTGKTTTCRHLANLFCADQARHSVTLVDVDVGQNSISIPTAIAAAFLEAPIPVDDDFCSVIPLVFFFGDKTVSETSRKRYLDICAWMHQSIQSLKHAKDNFRCGPVIINTMGWTRDLGYDLIKQLVSIFCVRHVLVTGGSPDALVEKLGSDFSMLGPGHLSIAKLRPNAIPESHKSALARNGLDRVRYRSSQLHQYFFGTLRTPLAPTRLVVFLKDVKLFDGRTLEEFPIKSLRPLTIAAVSAAPTEDRIPSMNVAGFVIITDIGKQTLTLLSPAPGKLPRPFLLVTDAINARTEDIPSLGAH